MYHKKTKMRILTITLATLIILLTSCGGEQRQPLTPEELRAELKQQELFNPTGYLEYKDVTLQPQKKKIRNAGLFRKAEYVDDGALIEGYIVNKATLAKFKDVVIRVTFYSQTESIIDEQSYVFYEYYEPNSSKAFSLKVDPPKAYKTFGLQVTDAKSAFE
jgi:hypothetical protein